MAVDPQIVADVLQAAQVAVIAHDGQKRKGSGHPYAVHPMRVAQKLLAGHESLPKDADLRTMVLAAVLHDTLEDTSIPEARLTELFGAQVASVVKELTQDKELPKAERRLKMVNGCGSYSLEAQVVKLADRWDNMTEMKSLGPEFIERYCEEAKVMVENMKGSWPLAEAAITKLIETNERNA
ncbi:MAG: HD domain-containing protein [Planctomycetota bacterium]|nr:HD domain-containing protein [Planctomycetota bacterium]